MRLAFALAVPIVAFTGLADVSATPLAWMSQALIRAEIVGHTLDGHYGNGVTWTESYGTDGRLDYKERGRRAVGSWHFEGPVFCTFYDRPNPESFVGGCWLVLKRSANCYEFYTAGGRAPDEADGQEQQPGIPPRWNARGWRTSEPATCEEKPSV